MRIEFVKHGWDLKKHPPATEGREVSLKDPFKIMFIY